MAAINQSESFQAAVNEGLSYFWASRHVGGSIEFVGSSWEDGGFSVDDEGNPVSDVRGNTVAKFLVEELDSACAAHVAQCDEWFNG